MQLSISPDGTIEFTKGPLESAEDIQKKEFAELRESEAAVRDVVFLTQQLESQIKENPTIIGFVGGSQRFINSTVNQMTLTAQVLGGTAIVDGKEASEISLLNPEIYNIPSFSGSAKQGAAFKSTVVRLSYILARAQEPGGRLSDRDIQSGIDQLGAGSGSPGQILSAIKTVRKNVIESFKNRYKSIHKQDPPSGLFVQPGEIIRYDSQGNRIQ